MSWNIAVNLVALCAWFVELCSLRFELHNFEIAHAQHANSWCKPDPNLKLNCYLTPKPNPNPSPKPSQIVQHNLQVVHLHKIRTSVSFVSHLLVIVTIKNDSIYKPAVCKHWKQDSVQSMDAGFEMSS